jgi:hypothetical protein
MRQQLGRRTARLLANAATLVVAAFAAIPGAAQEPPPATSPEPPGFRALLADAGIDSAQLSAFDPWDGSVDDAQAATISQILFRLTQFQRRIVPASSPGAGIGELAMADGTVRALRQVELPASAPADLRETRLFLCELTERSGQRVAILSNHVPAAWLARPADATLAEPVTAHGVRLGAVESAGVEIPLLLANRLAWRPAGGIAAGAAWLASRGFDVALLDGVRQNRPFARAADGTEAAAFYGALAALAEGDAAEIRRLARDAVVAEATRRDAIARSAAERRRELLEELEAALPERRAAIVQELAELRQVQAMASSVQKRAALGVSSVAPLFNEPAESVGKFVVIEGIARRAVRIVVDADVASPQTKGEPRGLTHYYELDVFPTDSQNNPVICCVARLPAGFPTGDLIREPVRVSGIFFKKWAYSRRPAAGAEPAESARIAPPLILAAEPQWLPATAPGRSDRGLRTGIAILAACVVVAVILFRTARRDRLARRQLARYDGPLDDLLEPK